MTDRHPITPARSRKPDKPSKPHKDFPLFAHNNGQWSKKVRSKIHHFGIWAAPQTALEKWLAQKDDLLAGRTPRMTGDGLTVRDLVNHFLTSKQRLLDSGEIKQRTFDELFATCERLTTKFGKERLVADLVAEDFESLRANIAKTWGPIRLGNEIQRVRSVFKYADDAGLVVRPVRFGPAFKKPSKKVLRKLRSKNGPRMFDASEIRQMLDAAGSVQLRAMILLGVNCGFGNEDCAALPINALDLATSWVTFARPKTGIARKCKLWPETVKAMRAVLEVRRGPADKALAHLVFITKHGGAWQNGAKGATALTFEMRKLLLSLKLKRPGLNFYALRHTFRTVADSCRDQPAVDYVMGHAPREDDMSAVYREMIEDSRLQAVADHVRVWLFGATKKANKATHKTK